MEQQAKNMLKRRRGKLHKAKIGEYAAVFVSDSIEARETLATLLALFYK